MLFVIPLVGYALMAIKPVTSDFVHMDVNCCANGLHIQKYSTFEKNILGVNIKAINRMQKQGEIKTEPFSFL